jgi:arginyl-tRNA synthetase
MDDMKGEIEAAVAAVCKELFGAEVRAALTRPDEQFGDYATNAALQLAQRLGKNPREVAGQIVEKLRVQLGDKARDITIAGPGFINVTLNDASLFDLANATPAKNYAGQKIVAEYGDPNPFKVLHAGHLYTSVVGDAVANLIENAGGEVHRVNFGGDVGLHVGKTMWAILFYETKGNIKDEELAWAQTKTYADKPLAARAAWLANYYVQGTEAYENGETPEAKTEIIELNKRVYQLFETNDRESPFAQIYWTCRQWSYDYFDEFYGRIGSHFEKYYPESETAPIGLKTVKEQLAKGVYEESDGAVIFNGEKYGLHTRVFITSHGLPTYEAKDVGLIMAKWRDYHFDKSIVITGNDIIEYMKVVLKSIEQFEPELAKRNAHLPHGNVKLAGGIKMSSRKGNILRATDVLDAAAEANKETADRNDKQAELGAVKYAFLKQRIGADIIYDPKESVSLEGNSGPYLQYAHARARSILARTSESPHISGEKLRSDAHVPNVRSASVLASHPELHDVTEILNGGDLEAGERSLLRKISEYAEVVDKATNELMPHHVCTYLYELAQVFNRFYEHNRVIGDEREAVRLRLVERYAGVLKNGLTLLGISAPERM